MCAALCLSAVKMERLPEKFGLKSISKKHVNCLQVVGCDHLHLNKSEAHTASLFPVLMLLSVCSM